MKSKQSVPNCVRQYGKPGDIKGGARNLDWYEVSLFSPDVESYWIGFNSLLDIGCGNGRINTIYKRYFKEIYGVDKVVDINEKFNYDNVTYQKGDFMDIEFDRKFDVISFIMSFRLMQDREATIEKCLDLLLPDGQIVVCESTYFEVDKKRCRTQFYELDKIIAPYGLYRDQVFDTKVPTRYSFIRRISEKREVKIGNSMNYLEHQPANLENV